MSRILVIAFRMTLFTLIVTGVLYPLATTAVAQILFPARANGSMVADEKGQVIGSELIAQGFTTLAYFQPRPSASGEKGYDATASTGSNYGPTSQKLRDRITTDLKRLQGENPDAPGPVPAELVLASGSGLDPEISPEAAAWQIARVARARGVALERVRALVDSTAEARELGILGEPRVNVLMLNLAMDRQFGKPQPTTTTQNLPTPPPTR